MWYTENYKRYYPRFEDGGKNKNVPVLPKELGLTPGTPEYLERQKRISGSANVVQPKAYITPKMVKNQYDLYRNKNEYIDRLNKLIPMEILMPLGGAGFVGHELNKE